MEYLPILGFLLAGYAVIANDSLQTLGTWLNSNKDIKWYWLWGFASIILMGVVFYGQYLGDVSYGRLDKIPYIEPSIWHVLAPLALLILTRKGIPVSTSFLVLSAFASTFIMEKMLVKSFLGYGVAAVVAYIIWFIVSKFIDEKSKPNPKWDKWWRIGQWFSTGFLWTQWLQHDHANIAVFLPREHSWLGTSLMIIFYIAVLGYVFKIGGGKIQQLVITKTNTKFVRSATIIDLVYAFLLLYFKQYNNIPMSTTFVFIGMLAGRELALNSFSKSGKIKTIFPLIGKDFLKLILGISISVAIVIAIQYFT
jgi:phosphate/sulfate permease